ncbi:MAG: histone H1 [Rhodobacteraceae bacterium]|nr:histone H1 [Paracoccaceae bacterium]
MTKGPQGQKRPGDVIGCAVHIGKIATGVIEDELGNSRQPNKARGGRIGGQAKAVKLSPKRRREIAIRGISPMGRMIAQ